MIIHEIDEIWESSNKVLVDEKNNQLIIYYSNRFIYKNDEIELYEFFNFYDLTTHEFKKVIYLEEKVSAKYMEIITVYEMNYIYWNLYVLKNLNRIFIIDNKYLTIYTFQDKELKLIKKKFIIKEKIIDIQEINNKGDHIIATNSSKIYYFKGNIDNNKKIKENYSLLEDITIIQKVNNDYDNNDDEYYYEDDEKIEDNFELNHNYSLFDYKKENFNCIKKDIKIRIKENMLILGN